MRTDTDDLARVRDPAIELLLSHAVTLPRRTVQPRRPVDGSACAPARSDQRRRVFIGSDGRSPCALVRLRFIAETVECAFDVGKTRLGSWK